MLILLKDIKEVIKNNFSPLEIKIWILIIVGYVAYFAGRFLGVFYSHLINSR